MISIRRFVDSVGLSGPVAIARMLGERGPTTAGPISVCELAIHSRPGAIHVIREPPPDTSSGDGSGRPHESEVGTIVTPLCLAEDLVLNFSLDPLFYKTSAGAATIEEGEHLTLRQGMLRNCPLVACLVAMARSPGYRTLLLKMVKEVPQSISSARRPAEHEYCAGQEKPHFRGYSADHHYVVTFRRRLVPADYAQRPDWLDCKVVQGPTVHVTGTLYRNMRDAPVGALHFAHIEAIDGETKGQPVWPGIIEKAYAVAKGNNTYEGLNQGLVPLEAMSDVAGPANRFRVAAMRDSKLIEVLGAFERRPTVMSTRDDLPADSVPPPNHTLAVVGLMPTPKGRQVSLFDAASNQLLNLPVANLARVFSEVVQVRSRRT